MPPYDTVKSIDGWLSYLESVYKTSYESTKTYWDRIRFQS
jgi:hypothetical protein